jgi:hypothetical protein
MLALNQLQILLLTASNQLKEIRQFAGLPATATHGEVLELLRDMPRGELGSAFVKPMPLQLVLMEHLANEGMNQLNDVRRVLGLSVDTSHEALMNALRDIARARAARIAPLDKVIPATEGGQ